MSRSAKKSAARKSLNDVIRIRGARQNNLKGVDLDLPLGKLNVSRGRAGRASRRWRLIRSMRKGSGAMWRRFRRIRGSSLSGWTSRRIPSRIPPAIAIEQVNNMRSTRSTVGTITEINDYLKMLFPRLAEATCPSCHRPVRPESPESILNELINAHAESRLSFCFRWRCRRMR